MDDDIFHFGVVDRALGPAAPRVQRARTTSASGGYIGGDLGGDTGTIVNGQHDHRRAVGAARAEDDLVGVQAGASRGLDGVRVDENATPAVTPWG